jgi:ABC-type transport system substrate-binding protein
MGIRHDRPPLNDKRVRQAMNYAIDKEALTKGLMGGMASIAKELYAQGSGALILDCHHTSMTRNGQKRCWPRPPARRSISARPTGVT